MGTKRKPGRYDAYAKAEKDEPLFTLLGRDPEAPFVIEAWASMRQARGEDAAQINEARACVNAMRRWRKTNRTGAAVAAPADLSDGQGRRAWLLAAALSSGTAMQDALVQAAVADRWIAGLLLDPARELSDRRWAATGDPGPVQTPPSVEVRRIIRAVCLAAEYSRQEILGEGRAKRLAHARHLAILLVRRRLGASLPRIGEWFKRDHTSILHAVRGAERRLRDDPAYLAFHQQVLQLLNGPPPVPPDQANRPTPAKATTPSRRPRVNGYSKIELTTIREGYESGRPVKEIAKVTGRSRRAIASKAQALGLSHNSSASGPLWTAARVALLRNGWQDTVTIPDLAAVVGVSPYLLRRKAAELKLPPRDYRVGKRAPRVSRKPDRQTQPEASAAAGPWTEARLSQLRLGWEGGVALHRLAAGVGLPETAVQAKAQELMWKRRAPAGQRTSGAVGWRSPRKPSLGRQERPKAPTKTIPKAGKPAPKAKPELGRSAPAPLTEKESALLRVFMHRPGATNETLAAETGLALMTVRGLLASLSRKKYIAFAGNARSAIRLPDGRPIPKQSTANDAALVAAYLAEKGATKCPTVVVELPTKYGPREGFL